MALSKFKVEIANFVCTADSQPLLDQFDRFYKAVSKPRTIEWRKSETIGYRFINVSLVEINGTIFLIGRLVKKIIHTSSQNLDEEQNKITKVVKRMKDDPSSAFVLRLFDHKIMIIEETKKAPRISDFENAFKKLLRIIHHEEYIAEKQKFKKSIQKQRMSTDDYNQFETSFYKKFPQFYLTITAIGSDKNIEGIFNNAKFINKYRVIIPHSNDENANVRDQFLSMLDKKRIDSGGDTTTSSEFVLKDNEIGLKKETMKGMTTEIANSGGMFKFQMTGKTNDNEQLNITEEKIKITYYIDVATSLAETAINAASKFQKMVNEGSVLLSKMTEEERMISLAKNIFDRLKNGKK